MSIFRKARTSLASLALLAVGSIGAQAQTDFPTIVTSTHPLAFYRLNATSGPSQVGATTYKVAGAASIVDTGAPVTTDNSHYLKLDGRTAYITTTQVGGIGGAATVMAWVNLAELPSNVGRLFYVVGESEMGNDLDLQIDTDNALKFYTARGGFIAYKLPPDSLIGQWHQVVATLETSTQKRAIYWDGKPVAADRGGGESDKKTVFTIGESSVFRGRFFPGSIDNVGLWSRALTANEVATIYASAGTTASRTAAAPAASGAMPSTGPFATKATVEVEDPAGKVQLRREEEIAYMFLSSIEVIEHNCQLTLEKVCPFNQILTGSYPPAGKNIEHLKFDPNKTDPYYTYTLAANGMAWEAHANPKKPGIKGWCFMSRDVGTTIVTYTRSGPSGYTDTPIGNRGMSGDSFASQ